MALSKPSYWKWTLSRLGGGRSSFATSTSPKMKAYSPALDYGHVRDTKPKAAPAKGDYVPVYVALGMIAVSSTLGLYTAMHQLKRAPNVQVRKSRRETIPELENPDRVADETDKFIRKSLFRNIAHIRDVDNLVVPDHVGGDILARPPRAETLKSVGVDPKIH